MNLDKEWSFASPINSVDCSKRKAKTISMEFSRQPLTEKCSNSPELSRDDRTEMRKLSKREATRLMYRDFQLTEDQIDLLAGLSDSDLEDDRSEENIVQERAPSINRGEIESIHESKTEEEKITPPPKRRRKRLSADQSLISCQENIISTPPDLKLAEDSQPALRRTRRRSSLAIYREQLNTEKAITVRKRKNKSTNEVTVCEEADYPTQSDDYTPNLSMNETELYKPTSQTLVNQSGTTAETVIQLQDETVTSSQSNHSVHDYYSTIPMDINSELEISCAFNLGDPLLQAESPRLPLLDITEHVNTVDKADQSECFLIETSQSNVTLFDEDPSEVSSDILLLYTSKLCAPIYPKAYTPIYEEPRLKNGEEIYFSKIGKKRSFDFSEGYYYHPSASRIAQRKRKAKLNGWKNKTSKERQALDELFTASMQRLDCECASEEN